VFLKYTVKYNVSFQDAVDDLFYDWHLFCVKNDWC
jgi:hypothetical protein